MRHVEAEMELSASRLARKMTRQNICGGPPSPKKFCIFHFGARERAREGEGKRKVSQSGALTGNFIRERVLENEELK